ncbi:MAG: hypothetical protein BGP24_18160 [Lysobacterales bacterium 69-70]|nr:hypothetical protein [Xanthomonadaceae bacterium]ODU32701.1 MAG: hypothetical protein ABS97_15320 [Xanthomonadaceae bacterium SCN 69-320]ODV19212.1 MAG: hypothetical protein ABT27_11835 [Xanthomonadaceae bacterium SCN 69-25]OJY99693.1 MAG: hypothetical protein BGP24_18160 [Xanthomonadales bacterium 69-70]
MRFDAAQLQVLNALGAEQERRHQIADIKQRWLAAQPGFVPAVVPVADPLLEQWIAACYDDCIALGVHRKADVLRYAFELLRAVQLGAGQEFVDGLRAYFCSYRYGSRHALEWIGHVMSQLHTQVHRSLIEQASPHG